MAILQQLVGGGSGSSLNTVTTSENVIINPNFEVWQKGTSFAGVPTVAESGKKFNYSLSVDCTTTDASIANYSIYRSHIASINALLSVEDVQAYDFQYNYLKNSNITVL